MANAKLSRRHWRLLVFLSVATFFEGYDFMALTQILPTIRAEFDLSRSAAGVMLGIINAGTILAWLLVRSADRWGRRRVLMITIAGYTLATLLTGLSGDMVLFTAAQFIARMFLIAEWAISTVYAAEEFPAERRATMIGVIQAFSSLGAIVCAGVVPLLLKTDLSWRSVYFVGVIPLALLAFARRSLGETRRFEEAQARGDTGHGHGLLHIFRTPYRGRLLWMALAWSLTYMGTQNTVTFWKEFAVADRGFSDADVGMSISIAAVAAMPLVFLAGKLLDSLGRKKGAVIIYTATTLGTVAAYSLEGRWPLTLALVGAIFGLSAVLPVLNNYTNELFPTDLRGDAFAWSNNLLGRVGYVLGPMLVGLLADPMGWGPAVCLTAIFPLFALVVILTALPETRGQELEQTSALATAD